MDRESVAIDYVANVRIPTEKAHGAQILKTCEAFAHVGVDVRLCVSARKSAITSDPFEYYGIQKKFPLLRAWSLNTVSWGSWGFRLQSLTFALGASTYIRQGSIVYGRDEMVLWAIRLFRKNPMLWESHTGSWNFFARRVVRSATSIVVISQGLKDFYVTRGVDVRKIIVAHDGVDLSSFEHVSSQVEARKQLGLPIDKKIVMYIGRLDGWKGVGTLLEASESFGNDMQLVVIGGESKQVELVQKKYPRVLFLGYIPYSAVANNQAAADVLVLPNTARDTTSRYYTSPLKLFTYMASGKPIVISDLPSIREVVTDREVFFVEPDNAHALAEGVLQALTAPDAFVRAAAARAKVVEYTWDTRVRRILAYIR